MRYFRPSLRRRYAAYVPTARDLESAITLSLSMRAKPFLPVRLTRHAFLCCTARILLAVLMCRAPPLQQADVSMPKLTSDEGIRKSWDALCIWGPDELTMSDDVRKQRAEAQSASMKLSLLSS